MAQSVERPTLAHVMISWFTGSSPVSDSMLTAQSLEPALWILSPSLCPSPAHARAHARSLSLSLSRSLSLSKINKTLKKIFLSNNEDLTLFNVISSNTDKHFTIYQALLLNYLYASPKCCDGRYFHLEK